MAAPPALRARATSRPRLGTRRGTGPDASEPVESKTRCMRTKTIKPPPLPPSSGHPRSATRNARPLDSELPPIGQRLGEILPLIFVVPVAGPPAILVVVPWVLFALMLTGPFLLLVTFVLAGFILVGITAVILAPPYLLLSRLREHSTRRHERRAPMHRSGELHPSGVSLLTQRSNGQLSSGRVAQHPAAAHLRNRAQTHVTSQGL